MLRQDYHTHTYRCKHAIGDVQDLASNALSQGLEVLGVSDHTALPDNWCPEIRMDISELPGYVEAIEIAQQEFPQLTILKGMECEYQERYYNFFREDLLGKWQFDYLALGQHIFYCEGELVYFWKGGMKGVKELRAYTEATVQGIESGLFAYLAHPDAFGHFYEAWDEETKACSRYIIEAAEAYRLPLEINGNGFRKGRIHTAQGLRFYYPLKQFWEIAACYNVQVVINSDAHQPEELGFNFREADELVKTYNLKLANLSYLAKKVENGNPKAAYLIRKVENGKL